MSFADPKTIWPVLSKMPREEKLEQQWQKDTGSCHIKLPEKAARSSQLGQR